MSRTDLRPLATDERRDLADFLATLTDEQWETPSLCEDWTVRQVVAHMISYDDLTVPRLLRRMVAGRFRLDGMNPLGVAAYDATSPAEVLTELRTHLRPRGLTAMGGGGIALTDGLVHHQDIRRALDAPRRVPAERLLPALGFALKALALPSRRHVRGLRLVATDLDWTHGDGPEVTGPGEAVLMAIAGRPAALTDLDGPGVATLAQRLTAKPAA